MHMTLLALTAAAGLIATHRRRPMARLPGEQLPQLSPGLAIVFNDSRDQAQSIVAPCRYGGSPRSTGRATIAETLVPC
jgi:hypothetical protein